MTAIDVFGLLVVIIISAFGLGLFIDGSINIAKQEILNAINKDKNEPPA